MPRGRTAVPDLLKRRRQGDAYKDPITPDPPEWLSIDAMTEWARLHPVLVERGHLGRVDRNAFAIYCQLIGIWKLLSEELARQPATTQGSEGQPRLNPLLRYHGEIVDRIRMFSEQFGFTPASRSKVDDNKEGDEASDLEKFLGRKTTDLAPDLEER